MKTRSNLRNTLELTVARAVLATLRHAPLGHFYAKALDFVAPRLRRTALRNLQIAFPKSDPQWRSATADEVFASMGRLLTTFAKLPSINATNVHKWIRYQGFEHYEQAKLRGRGVLFATAHLGNWELSAFAHALMTEPMNVVVRPLDNPMLDQWVETRRRLSGNKLLSKRNFARTILQSLRHNEPVGVLVDQNSASEHGVFINFFGVPASANLTFARLAARSGAAVIPGFAIWSETEQRYILRFYPEVEITGEAIEDTTRIQNAVEAAIGEYPGQWLWIHRRWKTRPPGEPSLYK